MRPEDRIIVALDVDTKDKALEIAEDLSGCIRMFKIGKELFTAEGPAVVREVIGKGARVFLDLKYHDIPNTVTGACRAAARLGVDMLNIHASGGSAMIQAAVAGAREGAEQAGRKCPAVLAVTVLTSIDEPILRRELCIERTPLEQVVFWANLAKENGANGVVCSSKEIQAVRKECGTDFIIVTPGIRPDWSSTDDQKRIATPAEAVGRGADYIVIGRSITSADSRKEAVQKIISELEN